MLTEALLGHFLRACHSRLVVDAYAVYCRVSYHCHNSLSINVLGISQDVEDYICEKKS